MNRPYALSISAFEGDFTKHGGHRRTQQIRLLVEEKLGYKFLHAPLIFSQPKSVLRKTVEVASTPKRWISNATTATVAGIRFDDAAKYRACDQLVQHNAQLIDQAQLVVWENTMPDYSFLPALIKTRFGKKIVACPHNLETLVPFQEQRGRGKDQYDFLQHEIESLAMADLVFTISEEDQWLLNLFGVKAEYLPYFPIGDLYSSLVQIREERKCIDTSKGQLLIIGSVNNPPTRVGVQNLLEHFKKLHDNKIHIPLVVTGFGTEMFRDGYASDYIKILGATHDSALTHLLTNSRAVLINQGFSSGALTKIPEFLVAGIPVITDEGGSRSFRRFDGVYVYRSFGELEEMVSNPLLPMPALPEIPIGALTAFQRMLA